MPNKKNAENAENFFCKICDFKCSKKSNFLKHLSTRKHEILTNPNKKMPKNATSFMCSCGKSYKHRSTLSSHQKKCVFKLQNKDIINDNVLDHKGFSSIENNNDDDENLNFKEMFLTMVDKNNELQNVVTEMCKQIPNSNQPVNNTVHNTTNNTTNNISNQNFNINVFLNENCKDALNMSDFIKSIEISVEDLQRINEQGQTIGMSNLLIEKLNNLDIFERPVHCSDIAKETIYIKDSDKWEEETKDRPKLKSALDQITKKSIQILPESITEPSEYVKTCEQILKNPREDKKIITTIANNVKIK